MSEDGPTPQAPGAGGAEGAARPAGEGAARPTDESDGSAAAPPAAGHRVWPWVALGVACAVGLGIFMWAVGGQFNLNGPPPSGKAATPQQAVEKFMTAIEAHDKGSAESYCTPAFAPQVQHWLDRAGFLKYDSAEVLGGHDGDQTVLRVSFGSVTRFMDGKDPRGLNLGFLVFPQPLKRTFVVVPDPSGSGWLVAGCDATP